MVGVDGVGVNVGTKTFVVITAWPKLVGALAGIALTVRMSCPGCVFDATVTITLNVAEVPGASRILDVFGAALTPGSIGPGVASTWIVKVSVMLPELFRVKL
jgi:hypothetical protein